MNEPDLKTFKEIAQAMDDHALTEEDIAEEAQKLADWIDEQILEEIVDSQVT